MKRNTRKLLVQVTVIVGLLILSVPGSVSAQDVTVSGKACPFFAGQTFPVPSGTTGDPAHDDYHGDQTDETIMPPHIGVCGGSTISIGATGTWGHPPLSGPDGIGYYDDTHDEYVDLGGISRVISPINTLIGVFLMDDPPDPGATPSSLILGDDMTTPELQQAFAIGSSLENITVPEGATRLFFGHQDGYGWYNNVGSLEVTVTTIVDIDIKPETLNLKSKGKFTAFIELPEGCGEEDVDISTIACEGAPAVKATTADNGRLVLKFDREDLVGVSAGDAVELTVTGQLTDGTPFTGSDTIRVIDKGGKK